MVVSLGVGWATLVLACIALNPWHSLTMKGLIFFALIGTVAPPIVRYLTYLGIDKLGPARSDPIRSLTPFFAIVFASFFFPNRSASA
jgi:drug/metabolite transporter (DMT)-like permease